MNKNQILQSEWLDILFDGKNKSYGALELRKMYNKRLENAMVIGISIAALFVTLILLANDSKSTTPAKNAGSYSS
jgi:periplasmic protein TonB